MNKKVLLIALPALMALSSCASFQRAPMQKDANFFKEDALAHEELFDDKNEFFEIKTMAPRKRSGADFAEPIIGVQYRAKYQNDADPNWYIAVRFVAAVKSTDVNATWTRAVYDAAGDIYGTVGTKVTTQAYTSLNSNGDPITPASFGTGYEYFVAYTLYDIPFNEKDDYFVVASVTLSDPDEVIDSVDSLAMAARIGGNVTAKFPKNTNGYFLAGRIGGLDNQVVTQEVSTPAGKLARFTGTLSANDNFYICHRQADASEFKIYDSSCLYHPNNPFLKDDGGAGKKIKAYSGHAFAFNFNSDEKIVDIESGYAVTYTNLSDSSVTTPLIYAGVDGSSKHQYAADISAKSGTTLSFTLDGSPVSPLKEGGANVSDLLAVTYGGEDLGCYLKDQTSGNYSLWMGFPVESYTLYINGSPNATESYVPGGWADKAIFELNIAAGALVQIKWGDTLFTADASTDNASYYRVTLHSDNSADCEDLVAEGYRLVGTINGDNKWSSDEYPLIRNLAASDAEYKLLNSVTLKSGDALKVKNGDTWYPAGSGNDYNVTTNGSHQVYFTPSGGHVGWHHGYFYVAKL